MIVLENLEVKLACGSWKGCLLEANTYADNNRLALRLYAPIESEELGVGVDVAMEPLATCTVNLPNEICPKDEIFVKDYSENEGMAEWLASEDIILPVPEAWVQSGYANIGRYKLTLAFYHKLMTVAMGGNSFVKR